MKQEVPKMIIEAINAMLAPYGGRYESNQEPSVRRIEEPRFINIVDAEAYSGLKRWTICRHARMGHYGFRKIGEAKRSNILIEKKTFDEWLSPKPESKMQQEG